LCPKLIGLASGGVPTMTQAEVIWHMLRPLSGDDLSRATRLRLVHKLGAGVNTIDVDTATQRGIAVANMPGANAPSVARVVNQPTGY
jgi:phosphoglycerate dehydrogenase-like enzyme